MVEGIDPKKVQTRIPTEAEKIRAEAERVEANKDALGDELFKWEVEKEDELTKWSWNPSKILDRILGGKAKRVNDYFKIAKEDYYKAEEEFKKLSNDPKQSPAEAKKILEASRKFLKSAALYLAASKTSLSLKEFIPLEERYSPRRATDRKELQETFSRLDNQPKPKEPGKIEIGPKMIEVAGEKDLGTGTLADLITRNIDPLKVVFEHGEDYYVILAENPDKIFKVAGGKDVAKRHGPISFKDFFKAEDIKKNVEKDVKESRLKPEEAEQAIRAARSERIQFVRSEYRDRVWLQLLAETS